MFFTIPQPSLTGAAAAGRLAFINSVGGFVGPFLVGYLKDATGSYSAGMLGMAAILMLSIPSPARSSSSSRTPEPHVASGRSIGFVRFGCGAKPRNARSGAEPRCRPGMTAIAIGCATFRL